MNTKHETAPSLGKSRGIMGIYAEAPNVLNAEARQLMADLGKTFADFRTANDERIAAMEKGLTDVVTNEKVDRINAEVTHLQAALDKALADLATDELLETLPEFGEERASQFIMAARAKAYA